MTHLRARQHAVLALVLETDGSTYAGAGDMVLFCNGGQVGWLSGGCLEPELARRAEQVSAAGRVDWIEIDTRSDDDLLSGSALGCRGRLRIALLPLRAMAGIDDVIEAWLREGVSLQRDLRTSGQVIFRAGHHEQAWQLHPMEGTQPLCEGAWHLPLPRLPRALVLGAVPKRPPWFRCCGAWGGGSAWPNGERAGPQPGSAQMRIFRPARPRPFMATHATRYW